MDLKDTIILLKEKITQDSTIPQTNPIELVNVKEALNNIDFMSLQTPDDYFLFFASLNLINAYIKQDNAEESISKSYSFKQHVSKGIEAILTWQPEGIKCFYDKNLAIINIEGLQFSFHNVEISNLMIDKKDSLEAITWEGIRLQPVANLIFEFATALPGLSKETIFSPNQEVDIQNVA